MSVESDQTADSWRSVREGVLERDGYECRFCGTTNDEHLEQHGRGLEAHHILPRADGGPDTPANLITVCVSCHRTLESTHAKAVGQLERESREGEIRAKAAATYAVRKSWAKAEALDEKLAEFVDGHPTFRREFAIYDENGGRGAPSVESHTLQDMLTDVSSEWAFLINWGYKQGLIGAAGFIEGPVPDAFDPEALAESNLPDPAESSDHA